MHPEAVHDALFLTVTLGELEERVHATDIHLFAYLAAILDLYEDDEVEWLYAFAATPDGSPFSPDLAEAIERSPTFGLSRQGSFLIAADRSRWFLEKLDDIPESHRRRRYLSSAAKTTLTLPKGAIRSYLRHEPALAVAREASSSRVLLDGPPLSALRSQLTHLRSALVGQQTELVAAALVWLIYLSGKPDTLMKLPQRG